MSKDIKDLIDTVEEENKIRAEFDQKIDVLKEKINKLNFTIKEQKILIADQKSKLLAFQENTPENIKELEETIAYQKQDLVKRYKEINSLNQKAQDLTDQLESYKKLDSQREVNEDLINAQKIIVQLTEENEQNRVQIQSLKKQIAEQSVNNHQVVENQELIELKKSNFQLMEENGLLRVQIEALKAQIQKAIEDGKSETLNSTRGEIENLKEEIEEYKAKIAYLKAKEKEIADSKRELEQLKNESLKFQKENEKLKQKLLELNEKKTPSISIQSNQLLKGPTSFPISYQKSLFMKIYKLLDDINKDRIIELLIMDLKKQDNEIKRNIIEILSQIRDKKVYDAFLKLIHDKDWLIRYNIIKAIVKFEEKKEDLKSLLENLSKDTDVDVRELAKKFLKELTQ